MTVEKLSAMGFRPPGKNGGFTLIEVLVTVAILAISLLGLAFLQAQGLKFTGDAYSRTQASFLAYDIMDRIRANAVNLGGYTGSPASTCDETTSSAANDLACWNEAIRVALGDSSSGGIAVNATVPSVDVTVNWVERVTRQELGDTSTAEVARSASWSMEL